MVNRRRWVEAVAAVFDLDLARNPFDVFAIGVIDIDMFAELLNAPDTVEFIA